jgi:Periplasmic binding protein
MFVTVSGKLLASLDRRRSVPGLRWPAIAGLTMLVRANCSGRHSASDPAIAIAAVGPLTGPSAARGQDQERAIRMAVDEANKAGGVNGRRIAVDVYDDSDQPARAREIATRIESTTPALAVLVKLRVPRPSRQAKFTRARNPGYNRGSFGLPRH